MRPGTSYSPNPSIREDLRVLFIEMTAIEKKQVLKLHSQVVGNVGLYYVCYRLSLMGWNAMPTARNARGIDILAYSGDGKVKVSFQVKALSKRAPVPLGLGLENLIADWIVVLNWAAHFPEGPTCFVMTTPEVERLVHISGDGKHSHWLQPNKYDTAEFKERWERIGRGDLVRPSPDATGAK